MVAAGAHWATVPATSGPRANPAVIATAARRAITLWSASPNGGSDASRSHAVPAPNAAPLPTPARTTPAVVRTVPHEPAPGEPLRVLMADDNVDYVDSMRILLESTGLAVTSVYDGLAAVEAAQSDPPDAAILDIGMPGLNGYEVARRLRAAPATAGCVLIAVSGWGQESDKRDALDAGFDRHLVKPVGVQALLEALAAVRSGRAGALPSTEPTEDRPA